MGAGTGFLSGAQLDVAAAFPANAAQKLLTFAAEGEPPGVLLRGGFLRRGERGDTLLYYRVKLLLTGLL